MTIEDELRQLIIDGLNLRHLSPEQISEDAPIFGGPLGLDSLDAVELVVLLQRKYGVPASLFEEHREALATLKTLAAFIRSRQESTP